MFSSIYHLFSAVPSEKIEYIFTIKIKMWKKSKNSCVAETCHNTSLKNNVMPERWIIRHMHHSHKNQLPVSSYSSNCPHATAQLPTDGLSWNFLFGGLLKLRHISISVKIRQKMRDTLHEDLQNFNLLVFITQTKL